MSEFPYWRQILPGFREMYRALANEDPPIVRDRLGNLVLVRRYPGDHRRVDGISNHFTEDARIDSSFNGNATPRDAFRTLCGDRSHTGVGKDSNVKLLGIEEQREKVYSATRECNVFNPAFAKIVYQRLGGFAPRVLDLSAGWGDRAIAAAAAGASVYHGTDPNPNLRTGYANIVKALQHVSSTVVEFSDLPGEEYLVREQYYDICLLSPPFFLLERYVDPADLESNAQSVERYPEYEEWVDKFLRPYYSNAYKGLRPGGWIVVYITDVHIQSGGGRVKYPLEHDSWKILRDLGARPGTTFGLTVQAPPAAASRHRHDFRSRAPPKAQDAEGKLRPARAWFRPPVVSPRGDAFLTFETKPLEIDSFVPAGRTNVCNIARTDRLGFGGKSLCPHRKFPADASTVYSMATRGNNCDAALVCAIAMASGSRLQVIIEPGSFSAAHVDRLTAYVSGLGGQVRKAASLDESRMLQAMPGHVVLPDGPPCRPEDFTIQARWLTYRLLDAFGKKFDGRVPRTVWVYYDSGMTASLLRSDLLKEIVIAVGFRDRESHTKFCKNCAKGPAADGYSIIGFGLSPADFVEEFYAKSTADDVLWFEG